MSQYCMDCGAENLDDAKFCKNCGKELKIYEQTRSSSEPTATTANIIVSKTSGKAIASLVLSLLWLYGIGSILAIIFGHIARSEIKNSNGRLTGGGIALAGLILGYLLSVVVFVGILAAVAIPKLAAH